MSKNAKRGERCNGDAMSRFAHNSVYSTRQKYSAPWSPSLVFLQYLLNKCKYQRQTFRIVSGINITRYVKI